MPGTPALASADRRRGSLDAGDVARRPYFTSVRKVKDRRQRATEVSSKHQVTIPVAELRAAGLEVGDRLVARADGPGRVVLEREHDVLGDFAGTLTGVYNHGELDALRSEWN